MSLKTQLVKKIKDLNGAVFTYSELTLYCKMWGYKISNAERRLREVIHAEGSEIEVGVSKKGAIVGYRMKQAQRTFL